ncbi:peptidoglycan bridge formation glycyltransferase FemA/FemB family protein [Candidatus Peregrinibacteria bacterium]|nr:MAG: peptidoglycan bridge formation glycyltransferase FemA/FemB family protein [Candidatus Peregrinibacteria bacterium]
MHVAVLDSSHKKVLNAFVTVAKGSPIEQSWEWGEFQVKIPGRPAFRVFAVVDAEGDEKEGAFLATLLVVRQEMGFGKTWLWAPRGPVFKEGMTAEEAHEAWGLLLEALRNWARLHGDVYLRVEPGFLPEALALGGCAESISYTPVHSLFLDLKKGEKKLLEEMTQKGRYNIKIAEKAGVKVRRGTEADVTAFHALVQQTGGRDGFSVHPLGFYRAFLEELDGKARLYVAEYEGRVVGGILATFFGSVATYYYGASSNEDRKVMAPYLIQWQAICDAIQEGCETYDFFGVAPEGDEKHAWAGVTQFKTRFGGQRVSYAGSRVFVYRPLWWRVVRLVKGWRDLF